MMSDPEMESRPVNGAGILSEYAIGGSREGPPLRLLWH